MTVLGFVLRVLNFSNFQLVTLCHVGLLVKLVL